MTFLTRNNCERSLGKTGQEKQNQSVSFNSLWIWLILTQRTSIIVSSSWCHYCLHFYFPTLNSKNGLPGWETVVWRLMRANVRPAGAFNVVFESGLLLVCPHVLLETLFRVKPLCSKLFGSLDNLHVPFWVMLKHKCSNIWNQRVVHFLQMERQEVADGTTGTLAFTNVCVTQLQALSEAGAYLHPLPFRPRSFLTAWS